MMKQNKMKKLLFAAALSAGIAVTVTGCSGRAKTDARPETVETGSEAGTDGAEAGTSGTETSGTTAAETTAATSKENSAKVQGDTVGVISGTVTDAGMSTVTIAAQKYPDGITFLKEDAATGFGEGLLVDHEITVFYRGEIKDGDTSGVTVELLRDKRDGDDDAEGAMVSGTVLSIGMSVISIETEDGKTISFEQEPKPVNTTDGPLEGDKVTILYSYQDEALEGAVTPELIR